MTGQHAEGAAGTSSALAGNARYNEALLGTTGYPEVAPAVLAWVLTTMAGPLGDPAEYGTEPLVILHGDHHQLVRDVVWGRDLLPFDDFYVTVPKYEVGGFHWSVTDSVRSLHANDLVEVGVVSGPRRRTTLGSRHVDWTTCDPLHQELYDGFRRGAHRPVMLMSWRPRPSRRQAEPPARVRGWAHIGGLPPLVTQGAGAPGTGRDLAHTPGLPRFSPNTSTLGRDRAVSARRARQADALVAFAAGGTGIGAAGRRVTVQQDTEDPNADAGALPCPPPPTGRSRA